MTKWKGYVASVQSEKETLKIILNVYDDEFIPSDESPDDQAPVTSLVINVPYNQPEEYVIDQIKKAIERHKIVTTDIDNKRSLIGREF